jgi:hypothetical protein
MSLRSPSTAPSYDVVDGESGALAEAVRLDAGEAIWTHVGKGSNAFKESGQPLSTRASIIHVFEIDRQ